jgi:hypothetical protein
MIDEGTSMADLKGLLDQFAKAMYGADKRTRFRPGTTRSPSRPWRSTSSAWCAAASAARRAVGAAG